MTFPEVLKSLRKGEKLNQTELAQMIGVSRSAIGMYESGKREPDFATLERIADCFNVSIDYLHGKDPLPRRFYEPTVTGSYTSFPVIGDIAAGYNRLAFEDWNSETVDIPNSYLRGRDKSEFFVLRVVGSSMYPMYQEGDRVLILRQETLNRSGDIGALIYNDEYATLKKIEYADNENWMRIVPINPNYEPELITGERLEHCRILGVPKLLIREFE